MNQPMNPQRLIRQRRRGAVTVEFALVCPIFFLVVSGTIEYARVHILRHSADDAAYEAARFGMVPGATVAEVETMAQSLLSSARIESATIAVTPDPLSDAAEQITVDIQVPVAANSWLVPRFCDGLVIHGTSTLRTVRYNPVN
jgi:Flp pilus assembly protein TadG